MVFRDAGNAQELAAALQARLSGPYVCRAGAKTVITAPATRVKILEPKEGEVRVGIGDALDLNL